MSGNASQVVTLAGVTAQSYVLAMLQNNRPDNWIRAVVPAADKFTIYFNKGVVGDSWVGYLALD